MNDHTHLTFEILDTVEADDPTHRRLLREALAAECPQCLRLLDLYMEQPGSSSTSYRGLWVRLNRRLPSLVAPVEHELDQADQAFEDLALLSPDDRRHLLSTNPRFSGRAFVDRLLEAARACRRSDPAASLAWATDALTALDRQPEPSADQRILALALQANAHRAAADLQSASSGFARARDLADEFDELDCETLAELDSLEASLLMNLQRFDEAEALLHRARETYQDLGQVTLAAQILIKLGYRFYLAGDPEIAIGPWKAAEDLLRPAGRPDLYLVVRFNLTLALFEMGQVIKSRDLLLWDESLYAEHADEHTAIRRTWLQARIAAATGETREAEALFVETRDAFAEHADGFDGALVSLHLAHLYHQLGRTDDLLNTVSTAIQLFSAYALHREALAALIMLRDAVHQQTATAETIERVASFLREAGKDPAARFQPPS